MAVQLTTDAPQAEGEFDLWLPGKALNGDAQRLFLTWLAVIKRIIGMQGHIMPYFLAATPHVGKGSQPAAMLCFTLRQTIYCKTLNNKNHALSIGFPNTAHSKHER